MKSQNNTSGYRFRGPVMKTVIGLTATAALFALASAASAENINVGGNAAVICSLPDTWETRTNIGGSFGDFTGTTWNIPPSAFANAQGLPNITQEIALRITGKTYCNSPHTITLSSTNGRLRNTTLATAPSGFSVARQVKYDAHWAVNDSLVGPDRRSGPGIFEWVPTGPGASTSASWAGKIPGSAFFDIRLAVLRSDGSSAVPLVAGTYSDTVTVTLTALP